MFLGEGMNGIRVQVEFLVLLFCSGVWQGFVFDVFSVYGVLGYFV